MWHELLFEGYLLVRPEVLENTVDARRIFYLYLSIIKVDANGYYPKFYDQYYFCFDKIKNTQ